LGGVGKGILAVRVDGFYGQRRILWPVGESREVDQLE
jgi:hypothetical protein